jgi:hypothetical protein
MSVCATSRYFIGGAIKNKALSNIDISKIVSKITSKPFTILKYGDLKPEMDLSYYNIILYQYDGDMGHWVLLKCDKDKHELYYFDSYGNKPDGAWPYLINTKGKNPEKRKASLMRELNTLEDEYVAIANKDYPKLREQYPYKALSYDDAKKTLLNKLLARITDISKELGFEPFKPKI